MYYVFGILCAASPMIVAIVFAVDGMTDEATDDIDRG